MLVLRVGGWVARSTAGTARQPRLFDIEELCGSSRGVLSLSTLVSWIPERRGETGLEPSALCGSDGMVGSD